MRGGEDVDAAAVRDVGQSLRDRWRARGARVEPPPPLVPEAPGPTAREGLDAIWREYHALSLGPAGELVRAFAAGAARTFGAGLSEDEHVELWLLTALIEEALGATEPATAAIERALAVRPDLEVDARRFPPTLADRVAELRAGRAPDVEVPIAVVPEDAVVFVDGRALGAGPRTLRLARGRHWVRAEAPYRLGAGLEIDAAPGLGPLRLGLAIDPPRALAALGLPGTPLAARVREAVAVLDATACLLDVSRGDGYRLSLVDDASGRQAQRTVARLGVEQDVTRLLDALLEEGGGDDSVWPWIVAGAAAALLAGGIVVGVLLNETEGWRAIGMR